MNPYLTKKARFRRPWDIPVIVLFGMLTFAVVVASVQVFDPRQIAVSLFAGALMIALAGLPVFLVTRRRLMQRSAQRLARCFVDLKEDTVAVEALERLTRMDRLEARLDRLIEKGYIQNAVLNRIQHAVTLTAPARPEVTELYTQAKCPSCGAPNRVLKTRPGRCAFCGQPLAIKTDE